METVAKEEAVKDKFFRCTIVRHFNGKPTVGEVKEIGIGIVRCSNMEAFVSCDYCFYVPGSVLNVPGSVRPQMRSR